MKAIKIKEGYVYKIYGGNIRYCEEPYYILDSTLKRYKERLDKMGVEYEIVDKQ